MDLPQDEVVASLELDIPDLPFDAKILARLEGYEQMSATLETEIAAGRVTPEILVRQEVLEAIMHDDFEKLGRLGVR
jgi:hypothetical protein